MTPEQLAGVAYDRFRLAIVRAHTRADKLSCPGCDYEEVKAQTKVMELPPYIELVKFVIEQVMAPQPAAVGGVERGRR